MLGRTRIHTRARGSGAGAAGATLLAQATAYLNGIAPYHWFDFVNDRCLYASNDVGGVSGATGYSFSRASSGYYTNSDGTLTNFGSGVLRRGDRGVLIEGARTNLLLRSQEFDNAAWSKIACSITANATTAPDGTTTADKLVENSATTDHYISQAVTTTAAAHTMTVYAKAAERTWIALLVFDSGGVARTTYYDIQNGAVGTVGTGVTASIQALANGWYLCRATIATAFAGEKTARVYLANGDGVFSYAGNGTSGVYIWQTDYQLGAFASSPIPTTSASSTRAADVLTYTVNSSAEIAAAVASETDLVTNGGFDADSDWTKGAGWTISGGAASADGSTQFSQLSQANVVGLGEIFAVEVNVASAGGSVTNIRVVMGGSFVGQINVSGAGTYRGLFTNTGASETMGLQTQAGTGAAYAISLDSVSIKAIPANSLTLYPLTLWAEFERAVDTGTFEEMFNLDDGDSSDRAVLYVGSTDLATASMSATSVNQGAAAVAGAVALNTVTKLAGRFQTNDMQAAKNGSLGTADTTCTLPAAPTRIVVGNTPLYGYISRIAIIQGAQSDANLQTVTT